MAMNLEILKESFEAIKPVAQEVVDEFYAVLFRDYPHAKPLFRPERMPQQKKALIHGLVTIFDKIENPAELNKYLASMGARHVRYGVQPEHYPWVAESLIKTLRFFFDKTWTPELEESWREALTVVAHGMLAGTQASEVKPPVLEDALKAEIEATAREVIHETIRQLIREPDATELAANQARGLIKEALQEQLRVLKERMSSSKKVA
jgi:hemoglobin-like flavoprotein